MRIGNELLIRFVIFKYKTFRFRRKASRVKIPFWKVTTSEATVTLKDIPAGTYAIAVIQDKNSDGEHNTNLFGSPTEPYGFSNNVYGRFGPPDFEDVSIVIENGKILSITVNLE